MGSVSFSKTEELYIIRGLRYVDEIWFADTF